MKIFQRQLLAAISVFALFASQTIHAQAEDVDRDRIKNLTDTQVTERLEYLDKAFAEGQDRAKYWYYGFTSGFGLLAFGYGLQAATIKMPDSIEEQVVLSYAAGVNPRLVAALAATGAPGRTKITDSDRLLYTAAAGSDGFVLSTLMQESFRQSDLVRFTKQNAIVNAWSSFVGFAALAALPFYPASASSMLKSMPDSTPEERKKKLEQAEMMMSDGAQTEAFGKSWIAHTATAAVSVLSGAGLTMGYKGSAADGFMIFAGSMLIGEAQILSQPTQAVDDWNDYSSRFYGDKKSASEPPVQFRSFAIYPGGFILIFTF